MRIDFDAIVSVPSRGLHFSNLIESTIISVTIPAFPSPHGDCISQMHIKWQEKRSEAASFRPLTGTAFLKLRDI